jgi:hypothetical protein
MACCRASGFIVYLVRNKEWLGTIQVISNDRSLFLITAMKKIPVLITGFLFLALVLHAQEKQSQYFIELAAGPSFPIGKFGEKTYKSLMEEDEPAGLAKTGVNLQATMGYYINESFGVLFSPGYSIHAQDGSGYEEFLTQTVVAYGGMMPTISSVEAKSWNILKLMAGGFMVTPLTMEEDLELNTRILLGACKTAVPGYTFSGRDQAGMPYGGTMDKVSLPWAFCYQVGLGLKYKLNDKLHVLFDVNSFNATAQREYTYTFPFSPNPVPPITEKVKYKLAEVNLMAGIGINF